MMLDVSTQELAFLSELLEAKQNAMLHEINHTDTNAFKDMLKEKLEVLETLQKRIELLASTQ